MINTYEELAGVYGNLSAVAQWHRSKGQPVPRDVASFLVKLETETVANLGHERASQLGARAQVHKVQALQTMEKHDEAAKLAPTFKRYYDGTEGLVGQKGQLDDDQLQQIREGKKKITIPGDKDNPAKEATVNNDHSRRLAVMDATAKLGGYGDDAEADRDQISTTARESYAEDAIDGDERRHHIAAAFDKQDADAIDVVAG